MNKLVALCLALSGCSGLTLTPIPVVSPSVTPIIAPLPTILPVVTPVPTVVPTIDPVPVIPMVSTPASVIDPSCTGITLDVFPQDAQGWTILPSLTQPGRRVIYVSSKNTVHNDGTNYWVNTSEAGVALLRAGMPDSILYARGETYHLASSILSVGLRGGATPALSKVVGAYGTGARPILMYNQPHSVIAVEGYQVSNLIITQLDVEADPTIAKQGVGFTLFPGGKNTDNVNVLVEDVKVEGFLNNFNVENITNAVVRRSEIFHACGLFRSQGIYGATNRGLTIDENVMDQNGLQICGNFSSGSPQAQNIYAQSDNVCYRARGNVITRALGNGMEARVGGDIEGNFFYGSSDAFNFAEVAGGSTEGKVCHRGEHGAVKGNVFLNNGIGVNFGNTASCDFSGNIIASTPGSTVKGNQAIALDGHCGIGIHGLNIHDNVVSGMEYFVGYQWGLPPGPVKMYNDGSTTQWTVTDQSSWNKDMYSTGMSGTPTGVMFWKYVNTPAPFPTDKPKNVGWQVGLSVNGADIWTDATPSVKVIDSVSTGILMTPSEQPIFFSGPDTIKNNQVNVTKCPFLVSQTCAKTNPAVNMPETGDNLSASFVNSAWTPTATLYTDMAAQTRENWNSSIEAKSLILQAQAAFTIK